MTGACRPTPNTSKPPTPAAMARMTLSELRKLPLHDRLRLDPERCPNIGEHTPHPSGYLAHAEWAAERLDTHKQHRCPGCGRYAIWVPLVADKDAP